MTRLVVCFLLLITAAGCQPDSNTTAPTQNTQPDEVPGSTVPSETGATGFQFKPSEREAEFANRNKTTRTVKPLVLSDIAELSGLVHTYDNGASPRALMVESTGGGVGWLDIERDGHPDLYCVQGGVPDANDAETRPGDSIFRQRSGRFINVAEVCLPEEHSFGQGVSVADFNNDGFDDIYVTNVGPNQLLINQGDGTFLEDRESAVCGKSVWSSSAAWGDVDKDGDLDLYVCNYAIYDPYNPVPCRDENGMPTICHPRHVEPEPDQFYVNQGDGTFTEASQQFGLFGPGNKALGVAISDFNRDGWPDIYVANDTTANFFFVNNGEGTAFSEQSFSLGGAFNALGETQASMGVAFGDYDENGYPDVCLTHFTGESNTLYQNLGPRGFQDVSALTGIRDLTLPKLGFGTIMCDLNADRCMDMFVTNGHIDPRNSDGDGYEMQAQLTSFDGVHWLDQSQSAGPFFSKRLVGRGVAMADWDGDGDIDLAVGHQNTPAALLSNESPAGCWLQVRPLPVTSNRSAVGVVATLSWAGGNQLTQELAGGTSFASAHQPFLFFGIGECSVPVELSIQWPSGILDKHTLSADALSTIVTVVEGGGLLEHGIGGRHTQDGN